ncbi:asparaginase [Planosporangium flavigriseum]|uniref:asparaginase n=1 Tax=Planosporangium flavigriseum TaxID=373681 RepID=A0A8J3LP58_9ACTN|nr:asparaginase [Planosporangium flavigriseum]NJC66662.1 asparaginase [Planosporangium flavigriseum]GIG76703.1 L-asparaginase [Planosporangium flavigriseum]
MVTLQLIATGGTIASRSTPQGLMAAAPAHELLARVSIPDGVTVNAKDVATRGSFAWSLDDAVGVVGTIDQALAEVDGVVVTHGTDTMEESVFLASLLLDGDLPVVFTGAQRPFDDPAPDGPANLRDALAVAASPLARGFGPLLCFDGHVFAARGVRKVDTLGAHAFDALGRGPVLRVAAGKVLPLAAPRRARPLASVRDGVALPRVDVLSLYVGTDDALVRAAVSAGAAGVVLAAFGAGNANPAIVEAVADLGAAGVPVLVCSRVPSGPVVPLYTGGGGADLARAGALFAADLTPWQARLLLSTALVADPHDPLRIVREYLATTPPIGGS